MVYALSKVLEHLGGAVKFSFLWFLYSTASFPYRFDMQSPTCSFKLHFRHSKSSVRNNLSFIFKRNPSFAEILQVFVNMEGTGRSIHW